MIQARRICCRNRCLLGLRRVYFLIKLRVAGSAINMAWRMALTKEGPHFLEIF